MESIKRNIILIQINSYNNNSNEIEFTKEIKFQYKNDFLIVHQMIQEVFKQTQLTNKCVLIKTNVYNKELNVDQEIKDYNCVVLNHSKYILHVRLTSIKSILNSNISQNDELFQIDYISRR